MPTPKWPGDHHAKHSAAAKKAWATRRANRQASIAALQPIVDATRNKQPYYVSSDTTDEQIQAMNRYAQSFYEYEVGVRPFRVAVPVVLTDKQSAKVRAKVREAIRADRG